MTDKKKKGKKESKEQELLELLQRTQASFDNFRKQTEKRFEEMQKFAAKDIILQVLPITDNFELALKNVKENSEFVEGTKLIYAQLKELLENNGIERIETKEQDFDPHLHEALMKVESELPENKIIEEFQPGFTLDGKVIRHAKVKVSAGKKED